MAAPVYPKLKYTYWGALTARGEAVRIILELHKVPFEDNRIDVAAFKEMKYDKSKILYGTVPVLEVDGKLLSGSNIIIRYLERLLKIERADPYEQAKVDELNDATENIMQRMYISDNATGDEKHRQELSDVVFPKWFDRVDHVIKTLSNGRAPGGHIFGDDESDLTSADLRVALLTRFFRSGTMDGVPKSVADGYPYIMSVYRKVFTNPRIAAHMEKAGVNDMLED